MIMDICVIMVITKIIVIVKLHLLRPGTILSTLGDFTL